jgi:hypothetical protein
VRGIADSRGQVLVPFPFPEPQGFGLGSPLRPGGIPLAGQTWQLHLAFAHTPGSTDGIPDLTQVLRQAPATAWDDELLSTPLTSATLIRRGAGAPHARGSGQPARFTLVVHVVDYPGGVTAITMQGGKECRNT